jgi:hypothetical protein
MLSVKLDKANTGRWKGDLSLQMKTDIKKELSHVLKEYNYEI